METKLRWFDHVEISLVDVVIRRVDRMEDSQTIRGRGRHVNAVTHSFFTFFFSSASCSQASMISSLSI